MIPKKNQTAKTEEPSFLEKIASSPLPIFKGLEAFIESNDKDNDARIAKEFKAHGGGVVTSKGEKSTSHAILNHRDDEINDPITVQVRPEWIDDSIKAGRLQDEQNYKPPMATASNEKHCSGNRNSLATSSAQRQEPLPKKRKPRAPAEANAEEPGDASTAPTIPWHGTQEPAMRKFRETEGAIIIKDGERKFGSLSDRRNFIKWWIMEGKRARPYSYYELIAEGCPARLYFDIEGVYSGKKPSDEKFEKEWLCLVLQTIEDGCKSGGIAENKLADRIVSSDCRPTKPTKDGSPRFKRSFHVTYPNVVFPDNHFSMKHFVETNVRPLFKADQRLQWTAEYKRGPVVKEVVDFQVYSKNRAFRLLHARKHGKTSLVPWNVKEWRQMRFESTEEQERFFERSLVMPAAGSDDDMFYPRDLQPLAAPNTCNGAPVGARGRTVQKKKPPSSQEDQKLASELVDQLSERRATEWNSWAEIVWTLKTIFGGSKEGLAVAHKFSRKAGTAYDEEATENMYHLGKGHLGFGTLQKAAWDDSPDSDESEEESAADGDDSEEESAEPTARNLLHLPKQSNKQGLSCEEDTAAEENDLEMSDQGPVHVMRGQGEVENNNEAAPHVQVAQQTGKAKVFSKLDEQHIHNMVAEFNEEYYSSKKGNKKKKRKRKREDGKEKGKLTPKEKLISNIVEYMNQFLCVVRRMAGKPVVLEECTVLEGNGQLVTLFINRSPNDAESAYKKHSFHLEGEKKTQTHTPMSIWLNHKDSRECDRVEFDPSGSADGAVHGGVLNMFRGLGIEKQNSIQNEEQAKVFTDHILHIWCSGDQKLCGFMLDWLAHLVQRPGVKMTCTPILKGGQGAGKSRIITMIGEILGNEHFIATTSLDAVTGIFQDEKIKTNLLMHLEECTYAGDKKKASVLKGLISEPKRKWEAKYVNPITITNHSNYIISSNYDEIVSVEKDDRRFLCMEVSNKYAGPQTPESKAYFDKLCSVDLRHVAYFLYNRNIEGFNPQAIPSTSYKRYQKRLNFGSARGWLEESLQKGTFTAADGRDAYTAAQFQTDCVGPEGATIRKQALYESYTAHANHSSQKFKSVMSKAALFKAFYTAIPQAKAVKKGSRGHQEHHVQLPSLEECRKSFAESIHEPDWEW